MTFEERAGAMADRLARAVLEAGLDDAAADAVGTSFRAVLAHRVDIADPHAPAALHPARNALILLDDADVRDPVELCAAIFYDGRRAAPASIPDPAVAGLLDELPWNAVAGDARAEMLVVASDAARRVALADHLDHARHLHLAPMEAWEPFHRITTDLWLPIAERTHPVLARRFRWWTGMFRRRWLPRTRT